MPVAMAIEFWSLVTKFQLEADRSQEGLEVVEEVLLGDSGFKVEKIQHLPFHQVDLGETKPKALVTLDCSVPCPVLVLWRGVVEILGSQDQCSKEDTVSGASHALGHWR
jgi:hypothetical protein